MRGINRCVQHAGDAFQAACGRYGIFAGSTDGHFAQSDFNGDRTCALAYKILHHGIKPRDAVIGLGNLRVDTLIIIVVHGPHSATPRRERSTIFAPLPPSPRAPGRRA
jgi:hypothetical protein